MEVARRTQKRSLSEFLGDSSSWDGTITNPTADLCSLPVPQDEFCERCGSINFDEVLAKKPKKAFGLYVTDLGTSVESLSCSACPLCRLFAAVSPPEPAEERPTWGEILRLRLFSANEAFANLKPWKISTTGDAVLLGVIRDEVGLRHNYFTKRLSSLSLEKTGYLGMVKPSETLDAFGVRLICPDKFDLGLAQGWLDFCEKNHSTACSSRNQALVTALRVIDCRTREVVPAPTNYYYVALSYVWGLPASEQLAETRKGRNILILGSVPKVIEHSIEVTLKLGLRFLWIDKYCINQDDQDKQCQIRQMDSIYANAQLTIIAAAGEDSGHELPGISGTPRKQQPFGYIGDQLFACTMAKGYNRLSESKWANRAWTYQEGLLSKRRLIFTDEQVFYECNAMHCEECLIVPLATMHTERKDRFTASVPGGAFALKRPGSDPSKFWNYISKYYTREMTYETDVLNAMQGIFRVFKKARRKVYQLWGVPITSAALGGAQITRRAPEFFLLSLLWYHTGLSSERRFNFPSWSWCGWRGGQLIAPRYYFQTGFGFSARVWVENLDGQLVSMPDFNLLPDFISRADRYTNFVIIDAWAIDLICVWLPSEPAVWNISDKDVLLSPHFEPGYYGRFSISNDAFGYASIKLSQPIDSSRGSAFTALITSHFVPHPTLTWLVMEDKGASFERVGVLIFNTVRSEEDRHVFCYNPFFVDNIPKTRRRIRLG